MHLPVQLQTIFIQHRSIALFVPVEAVVNEARQRGEGQAPYWSKVWPAAKGLSEFLLLYPGYIQSKFVMELGAGLGLPSLIAAPQASNVLCTDYVPDAITVAQQSADYNGLKNFSTQVLDWQQFPDDLKPDVVLLSDVNYNPSDFDILVKLIETLLQKGATIILSTPQRLMAKDFIALLMAFCIKQEEVSVTQNGTTVIITVLVLQNASSQLI